MLGVPVEGPTYFFGDNMSVILNVSNPQSPLTKRHNILSYHRVREAVAAGITRVFHIDGKANPADILTKNLRNTVAYSLMKPYLFWKYERPSEPHSDGSVKQDSMSPDSVNSRHPQSQNSGFYVHVRISPT